MSNNSTKKLPNLNKQLVPNYDNTTCNLKFSRCDDNKYQLCALNKEQLKRFVSFAKKIENMKWVDINNSTSINYENINNLKKPDFISNDINLKSMRVDKKFRIYGYRMRNDFYIIWFDPNHELT